MIIKIFDNGWGKEFALKQFEQGLVGQMLRHINLDESSTVVINSVWYTGNYHEEVMSWLRNNSFDQIVLIAMLDAAIPYPEKYQEFDCQIMTLGYYPGHYHLDFWALFVDKFFDFPDMSFLMDHDMIDTPFMCLNRKPHWHRKKLYQKLLHLGLDNKGIVTMGDETGCPLKKIDDDVPHRDLAPNSSRDHYGIPNDIASLGKMDLWQRCFLNIVTETVYDINTNNFVSEKIFKPIVGCRPFLVYDPDGATRWLEDRGFQHYAEDFSDICDLEIQRPENLPAFLEILSSQPASYFRKKFLDLEQKIMYNKFNFDRYINSQLEILHKGIVCLT